MVRRITYICDMCGSEFPYEIKADEHDRPMLLRLRNWEVCSRCVKKFVAIIEQHRAENIKM